MKLFHISILSVIIISCGQTEQNIDAKMESKHTSKSTNYSLNQTAEPFALLELFTSEGCSDCPAAEGLLNEIALDAWADREYIYALSFHVDYWNKLGWKDEFSKSELSDRQRDYRKSFKNEVIYTPQMIVNGTEEFVGSDTARLETSIEHALSMQPKIYFTITPNEEWSEISIDPVTIDKVIESNSEDYELNICIVERGLETEIRRGENEGRTLKHENIVRHLQTENWSSQTSIYPLSYNATFNEKFSIVCFVQNKTTRSIVGANIWNY